MAERSQPTAERTVPDKSRSKSLPLPGDRRIDLGVLLGGGGVSCLAVVGWLAAGVVGLGVGVALAVISTRSRPVVTAALAQGGLLVVVPEIATGRSLLFLAAFELGVVAILLSERPVDPPTVALTVAFGTVFIGLLVSALLWTDLLAASVLLVVLTAVLGYGIHRFERLSLGLIPDQSSDLTTKSSQ